ncbi:serine protease [Pseudoalteromonas xiamenensis]|uniref:serine protease n=1 Tax=Pseudoalteromonas xiamenensis TaxID=882626 RepID=UPI0035E92DE9
MKKVLILSWFGIMASMANAGTLNLHLANESFTPKIVGGEVTLDGERPWMVSLQFQERHFCGASLISDQWVLTAAHCVEDIKKSELSQMRVQFDFTNLASGKGKVAKIEDIYIHEDYKMGKPTDVALIKLTQPVSNGVFVSLATPSTANLVKPGILATVSGWGAIASGGDGSEQLLKVSIPLVSNEVCNSSVAYNGRISSTELCAGLEKGEKDSCQGDSGGPLVIAGPNNRPLQVGVVSWGDGCALPNKYGVYARVSSFSAWIDDVKSNPNKHLGLDDSPTGPTLPDDGAPLQDEGVGQLVADLSGDKDSTQEFEIDIPEGTRVLWIDTIGGKGDVDLILEDEDGIYMTSEQDGNDEHMLIEYPEKGKKILKLIGVEAYSGVELAVMTR